MTRRCRGSRTSVLGKMLIVFAAFGFSAALYAAAGPDDIRTWTDSTGKFKVTAKFVRVSDGKVTLEREDGSQVEIPLEKLSEADRKTVADIQADDESPFKATKPIKKAPKKATQQQKPDDEDEISATDYGEIVRPRWSGVKQVLAVPTKEKWSLSIEVPKEPAARPGRPIAFPGKTEFFEHIAPPAMNPVCRRALVAYLLDKGQTRVYLCDLENAAVLAKGKIAGKLLPLALNDAGDQVLMRREESQDRLETWTVSPSGISKVREWIPHDDQKGGDRNIKWARYVSGENLLTASGGGKLTLWEAATCKPLYWLKMQGACFPALSPDRKYVAFAGDKEIGVLDVGAGEVVVVLRTPQRFAFPAFAFTPKGTRLACSAFDRIYIWDVPTGALYREISMVGNFIHGGENLLCPTEEHILAGNRLLLDIESQARLWTYEGHEHVAMLGGVCWFEVLESDAGALVSSILPHPGALDTIQKALESPDFFVVKPGVTVTLNVSALADPTERERAAAALTKKLQANGCQVGAKGVVEFVATTEAGRRREVSYHSFGRPGARSYTVQEFTSRLKVVYQGQTAWEVAATSLPGFVQLKDGETMDEYLKRSEHPNYEWFSKVELPKLVQKPTAGATTLGTTRVTTAGVR
jgi:hypothetical protein